MHPKLKALYARNRKRGEFRAEQKQGDDNATLYLYDMIVDSDDEAEWWGGVSPGAFSRALASLTAPTIHLRVNSPGGSVFAARSMEQAIREHSSRIVTHIDGLAASAATFLILPSDEIIVAPGSFYMIHEAWTIMWGNKRDLRKEADLLEQIDGSLVKSYAAKSGQKPEDIAAWMEAETWFEADRAVELGFADSVAEEKPAAKAQACAEGRPAPAAWDLSAYLNAPRAARRPAAQPPTDPAPQPDREALRRDVLRALIPA
nr:head maturation protease, ClpP-related [Variovorax boronicumulans]